MSAEIITFPAGSARRQRLRLTRTCPTAPSQNSLASITRRSAGHVGNIPHLMMSHASGIGNAVAAVEADRRARGLGPLDCNLNPTRNATNPLRRHLHTLRKAITDGNKLPHAVGDEELASVSAGIASARLVAEQLALVLAKWTAAPS